MHPGTSRSLVLTAVQLLAALLAVLVLREVLPDGVEGGEFLAVFVMVVVLMGVNYVYWAIRDGWWLPSIPSRSEPDERREALRERLAARRGERASPGSDGEETAEPGNAGDD